MSLISLLVVLVVAGVVLWAVTTYIPMHPTVKSIIVGVVVVALVLLVLRAFGVLGALERVRV